MQDFRTPLGRVRGLGSAKTGTHHFISHRVTAIALAILIPWFLVQVLTIQGLDYVATRAWLSSPYHAIMMLLLVITVFHHVRLGLQVVVEDYVQSEGAKIVTLVAINLAAIGLGVACAFSILKIAFGA